MDENAAEASANSSTLSLELKCNGADRSTAEAYFRKRRGQLSVLFPRSLSRKLIILTKTCFHDCLPYVLVLRAKRGIFLSCEVLLSIVAEKV